MKRPTVKDVAQAAGVSAMTVSRVIRGVGSVSDPVKGRVLAAIQNLQYRPNINARSLKHQHSYSIGLIVADIANPFFGTMAKGMEAEVYQRGYNLIVSNTDGDPKREEEHLSRFLEEGEAAGVALVTAGQSLKKLATLEAMGFPVVLVDNLLPGTNFDAVATNNFRGGYMATKYLLQLGHRRIGIITGPMSEHSAAERLRGYKAAMEEQGLKVDPKGIWPGDYQQEKGYQGTTELLLSSFNPTALFVCNNLMSLGALEAIRELQLRVPEDVSVVGFDDSEFLALTNPPLSTIGQANYEMGAKAAQFLLERIEGKRTEQKALLLEPRLMVRHSCRKYEAGEA